MFLFLSCGYYVFAETVETTPSYNRTYQYPFSMGAEVQFLSPMSLLDTDFGGDFNTTDFSVFGRVPLPVLPVLQPLLRLGMVIQQAQYNDGDSDLFKFDNNRFYVNAGVGYFHKFSKQLEGGFDLEVGFGYSIFPGIDLVDREPRGAGNLQAALGGRVVFNPSYNLSLNVHPSIQYFHSLSPLERFNGFSLGIGITLDYRFGTDPDDPQIRIRSIEFRNPQVDDVFAAMQSYYVTNPMGEVELINTEKFPLTDLIVTFFQPGYMNIATIVAEVDELAPGEVIKVPITASYDQNVFTLEGVTPLTGEIQVEYRLRNRSAVQTVPVSYDLYDKNSITWDDDRKVAAFITSGDSALSNYVSYLRQSSKDVVNPGYSESIQVAMQVFAGLTEIGSIYQSDPTLAFEDAQGNALVVDTVNLPRETLVKRAGDCDDLMVLYNALLESAGIETGFISAPGHIYSVFSTGLPARDYKLIHPEKIMTIPIEGVLWVPVEITFLGEDDFFVAWRSGAEEFAQLVNDDTLGLYFTRTSQNIYRPVGFEEQDLGLQYGDGTTVMQDFAVLLNRATRLVIDDFQRIAQEDNSKGSWNKLGIVAARYQDYNSAESAFFNALSLDRNYLPAKINLANVYYKREEYQNALRLYHEAEQTLRGAEQTNEASYGRLLLNIARTYHEVENFGQAARYFQRLSEVNLELASRYDYLSDKTGDTPEFSPSFQSR